MGTIIWKETKYGCTLLTALYQLQQANVMCDLEIKSKNLNIPVHKLVLQAFNGTIYSNQLNKPSNIEDLVAKCGNFDSNTVLALIQYLYTGEVVIEKNEVERFFKLCKDFQLDNVVSSIQEECSRLEKCLNQRRCIPSAPTSAHDSVIDTKVNMPDISVQSADPSRSLEDSLMELNSTLMMVVKEEPVDNFLCEKDTSDNSNGFMEESSPKKSKTELLENEQTQKDGAIKLRMCCICSKIFENEDEYVSHMEAEHELYTCSKCDFQDQKKSNLIMHIAEKHSGNSERPTNDSRVKRNKLYQYKCPAPGCPEIFRSRNGLWCHKRRVHPEKDQKTIQCEECGKTFGMKSHLVEHMARHNNSHNYTCDKCGKAMKYRHSLVRHLQMCVGVKVKEAKPKVKCSVCDLELKNDYIYRQHYKQKHGDAKWLCATCGGVFKWGSSFSRHVNSNRCKKKKDNQGNEPQKLEI